MAAPVATPDRAIVESYPAVRRNEPEPDSNELEEEPVVIDISRDPAIGDVNDQAIGHIDADVIMNSNARRRRAYIHGYGRRHTNLYAPALEKSERTPYYRAPTIALPDKGPYQPAPYQPASHKEMHPTHKRQPSPMSSSKTGLLCHCLLCRPRLYRSDKPLASELHM